MQKHEIKFAIVYRNEAKVAWFTMSGKLITKVGTLKKMYVFFLSYLQLVVRNLSQNVLDLEY
jgi:hypothetical protein